MMKEIDILLNRLEMELIFNDNQKEIENLRNKIKQLKRDALIDEILS